MTYSAQYCALISNRLQHPLTQGCFEKHHIIPKSEGGTDDADNIVRLTLREHFVAHKLLYKIYHDAKMAQAFLMMSNRLKNKNSKMYENARIAARPLLSENGKASMAKMTSEQHAKGGKAAIVKMTHEQHVKAGKAGAAKLTFEQRSKAGKIGGKITTEKLTPEQLTARGKKAGKMNKGSHWYNNGIINKRAKECPPGFVPGRLTKKGK